MLNIFLCAQNPQVLTLYKMLIKDYASSYPEKNMQIILALNNPQRLETFIAANPHLAGLYFLDLGFSPAPTRGLQLAETIRCNDHRAKIVFITKHKEFAYRSIEAKVEPLDYILKDQTWEHIHEQVIQDIRIALASQFEKDPQTHFIYQTGAQTHVLSLEQVDFLETSPNPHKIILVTNQQRQEFRGNLSDVVQQAAELYRVSKSLVVNLHNIRIIDAHAAKIIFADQKECYLPRKKIKALKQVLALTPR
ncbi:response regulator transcription factor [Lactobacillus sp. DCY120]|uniref:Response regulator transcription factor n=1 Tax=Bombilactobacillus apium TaxID=2675299 RepID=A0A850QX82_9LACO|nr:LytTR family DNA-binding domain-containing protein [Bombilactobacillus apium]NVY96424.1 response regulator transcription factor [Bombilactobacillus apium]